MIVQTPFSAAYWRASAREFKNTRSLAMAALLIALRVAVRSISIPIAENLYISIGFIPNALGSLIYGPAVALMAGAVSDVLGSFLFPRGPFFPPFMLVEMLSSFIFAIFLYKAPLKIWRVAFSKLLVNLLCNIILTPLFLAWMTSQAAILASMPRIAKNIALFPFETFLLVVVFNSLLPALIKLHVVDGQIIDEQAPLHLNTRHILLLLAMLIFSAGVVWLYLFLF